MADPREEERPGPEWCEDKLCSGYGGRHAGKHVPFLPPEPRKGLTGEAEALARLIVEKQAWPESVLSDEYDALLPALTSWLERHDVALREQEGLACTDCKEYRAKVAGRLAAAEQMAQAIESAYYQTEEGLRHARAALAAWRSGEGKP